jgi:hypothetical protein
MFEQRNVGAQPLLTDDELEYVYVAPRMGGRARLHVDASKG